MLISVGLWSYAQITKHASTLLYPPSPLSLDAALCQFGDRLPQRVIDGGDSYAPSS